MYNMERNILNKSLFSRSVKYVELTNKYFVLYFELLKYLFLKTLLYF